MNPRVMRMRRSTEEENELTEALLERHSRELVPADGGTIMDAPSVKRKCRNCKYFDLDMLEGEETGHSWCYRYPPVYVGPDVDSMRPDEVPNESGYWEAPTVGVAYCCGEFTPREDATDVCDDRMEMSDALDLLGKYEIRFERAEHTRNLLVRLVSDMLEFCEKDDYCHTDCERYRENKCYAPYLAEISECSMPTVFRRRFNEALGNDSEP